MIKLSEVELRKIPKLGERVETEGILWRSPVTCLANSGPFQLWRVKGHTRWDDEIGESVVEQAEYALVLIEEREGLFGKILYTEMPSRQWYNRKQVLTRVVEILAYHYQSREDELAGLVSVIEIKNEDDNLNVMVGQEKVGKIPS